MKARSLKTLQSRIQRKITPTQKKTFCLAGYPTGLVNNCHKGDNLDKTVFFLVCQFLVKIKANSHYVYNQNSFSIKLARVFLSTGSLLPVTDRCYSSPPKHYTSQNLQYSQHMPKTKSDCPQI